MKKVLIIVVITSLLILISGCRKQDETNSSKKSIDENKERITEKTEENPHFTEEKEASSIDDAPAVIRKRTIDTKLLSGNDNLQDIYMKYSKSRDDKVLKSLEPADIFLLLVYSMEKQDVETICYLTNLNDPDLPTIDEFLQEVRNDSANKTNIQKLYEEIMNDTNRIDEVILDDDNAFVNIIFKSKTEEEKLVYRFEKTEIGVWKLGWG